jgi:hypothetical protein
MAARQPEADASTRVPSLATHNSSSWSMPAAPEEWSLAAIRRERPQILALRRAGDTHGHAAGAA